MIPRGYFYVISCACSFGLITTLAKISFNEGATPQTVVFFRILSTSILMGLWSFWTGRKTQSGKKSKEQVPSRLPVTVTIVVTGICISVMSLGYLGSVKYIPVSLSVLLFFTFPFWVLIINYIIDREIPKLHKLFAFIVAFFGLALSLGPTWEVLDLLGIVLVLCGSVASAGYIVAGSKAVQMIATPVLLFYSNTLAVFLVGAVMFYTETFSISHTILGWTGIGAVCLLFTIGQFFLFTGTKHTGSAQASLILNVEPLISIVAAIILLGERLAVAQFIGVAVVITALFLAGDNPKRLFLRQKRLIEK